MQFATDADLAAATVASDRFIVHTLEADWALDGNFQHALSNLTQVAKSIAVERSITGTLPEETTLVEGFYAAEMSVTLAGVLPSQVSHIAILLSSLRTDSPLYGRAKTQVPIRWSGSFRTATGTAPMMRQFTGYIVDCSIQGKEVQLKCRDGVERLHAEVNMPIYAKSSQLPQNINQFRINSQWPIDYVLRQNGIYQSPPMQLGCVYSATGHGAMIPERGYQFDLSGSIGACTEDDPIWVSGRWGIAYLGNEKYGSLWSGRITDTFWAIENNTYTFQCQVNVDYAARLRSDVDPAGPGFGASVVTVGTSRGAFETGSTAVALRINSSKQLFADFYNGATRVQTVNGPVIAASGWSDIWCRVSFKGATLNNCTVEFPNQSSTGVNLTALSTAPLTMFGSGWVITTAHLPVQNIQVCHSPVFEGIGTLYNPDTWVTQCDLDPGLNEFSSLPIVRGEDSYDVLKDLVQTEYGVMGFNESGRFFFTNRQTVRRQGLNTVKVLDAERELQDLSIAERSGSIRNIVSTTAADRLGSPGYERVFTLDNINDIVVPPGFSTFVIQLDQPCLPFIGVQIVSSTQAAWDAGDSQLPNAFVTTDTFSFAEVTSSATFFPDFTALEQGVDLVRVDMTVNGNFPVRFSTTSGSVAFNYGGIISQEKPDETNYYRRQSSIDRFGEQLLKLDKNQWRQISRSIQPVALMLLKDLKAPLPIIDRIPTRGDFRTQLNDVMTLDDRHGLGGPVTVALAGIQREFDGSKLSDTLIIRTIASPGKWILGHPTQSILGATTVLG